MRELRVVGIIPARMAATRLPGKPLVDINGKPMLRHVWERACLASSLREVLIATPDPEIAEAVAAFGGRAVMTSDRHRSGTDRLAEAAADLEADVIVNIQGDEPLVDPAMIDDAVRPFREDTELQMTSLMCPCPDDQLDSPSTVKVVCDLADNALYFSRSRIPFPRSGSQMKPVMQHIGLYAYRRDFLLAYAAMPPSPLEQTEMLEQLRVLEHGVRIRMVAVHAAPLSVDTPQDLAAVRAMLSASPGSVV